MQGRAWHTSVEPGCGKDWAVFSCRPCRCLLALFCLLTRPNYACRLHQRDWGSDEELNVGAGAQEMKGEVISSPSKGPWQAPPDSPPPPPDSPESLVPGEASRFRRRAADPGLFLGGEKCVHLNKRKGKELRLVPVLFPMDDSHEEVSMVEING